MRATVLFLVLIIVLLVAYTLVPVEQMQSQAKNTIQQAQSFDTSFDLNTITDEFGTLFEKQKDILSKKQEDGTGVQDMPVQDSNNTVSEESIQSETQQESDAVLVR